MSHTPGRDEDQRSLNALRMKLRAAMPELYRRYGVRSIEIFGSYVRGEQRKKSDLDLLVEFDAARPVSLFEFVALEQFLSDALGVKVDLVEKTAIKPAFRKRILAEAVPV